MKACSYIITKCPLKEEWLSHAEVVDIEKRSSRSFTSVKFFIEKLTMDLQVDKVHHEFLRYQIDNLNLKSVSIDEQWRELEVAYPNLARVMLVVLSIQGMQTVKDCLALLDMLTQTLDKA